jgi:cbb3-type cytochrome oxidase subunit 3
MEDTMGWLWSTMTVLGPLLLLGVIIWATLSNLRGGRRNFDEAERGALKVREEDQRR